MVLLGLIGDIVPVGFGGFGDIVPVGFGGFGDIVQLGFGDIVPLGFGGFGDIVPLGFGDIVPLGFGDIVLLVSGFDVIGGRDVLGTLIIEGVTNGEVSFAALNTKFVLTSVFVSVLVWVNCLVCRLRA